MRAAEGVGQKWAGFTAITRYFIDPVGIVTQIRRKSEGFFPVATIQSMREPVHQRGIRDDHVAKEQMLRRAVLDGDERAWRTLYDESFDELQHFVLWRCGGRRETADEIVQETWLTAVRRIGKFDPQLGTFADWLRGIAANLLRNYVRRRSAAHQFSQPLQGDSAARNGESTLEQYERAARITAVLVALPDRYEAVLKAKYLDRLSVIEIAADWKETPKAIESLLTRSREAFRKLYHDPQAE